MILRARNIKALSSQTFDVLIIGAGINGAASAAALSAKGASVALIDKGDFAGFTSSNSSNLAWGGIKYLESHEYTLVNELCKSRNHLMASYPSTVKEIRFLTTIEKGFRYPAYVVYLGAVLYWILGRLFTQAPKYLRPSDIHHRESVVNTKNSIGGVEYSDAYLFDNDARFVFNFVRSAMDKGCIAANYIAALSGEYRNGEHLNGQWKISAKDEMSGEAFSIQAKSLINACGPFVDGLNRKLNEQTRHRHVFSKGIHLIVDRLSDGHRVLTFFASDGRPFFVIPMGRKTCIGTTDTQVDSPYSGVSEEDRQFVLDNVNQRLNLAKPLTCEDIISERCGVRPLAVKNSKESNRATPDKRASDKQWLQLSRKHAIDVNTARSMMSIFGGKLTDCINLGEEVCEHITGFGVALMYSGSQWYGEPKEGIKQAFFQRAKAMSLDDLTWSQASEPLSQRFWRRYGEKAFYMLDEIARDPAQAKLLVENAEYTRCEIEYAKEHEMIVKLEDFLRRRSKISMVLSPQDIIHAAGLKTACEIFFGNKAEEKLREYIDTATKTESTL